VGRNVIHLVAILIVVVLLVGMPSGNEWPVIIGLVAILAVWLIWQVVRVRRGR
jgi:L-asparagine transporter-like permease